jgi:hypothetical protein
MRATEFLTERALAPSDFYKQDRIDTFYTKLSKGQPFTLAGGGEVVLKRSPGVLSIIRDLDEYSYKEFPKDFITSDNRPLKLNQLEKTAEFGGQSATSGEVNKETLPVKPSQIGITGTEMKFDPEAVNALETALATGAFPAGELDSKIQNNNVLKSAGLVGETVINMSRQISSGQVPNMPTKKELPVVALKAIRDYAGEYLGIQQLVDGTANFPNNDIFFKFMGTDQAGMKNLILYFPKSSNTPLADSLALQNSKTGHVIKLSSKGADKGAPPSMDNLKVPDSLRKERNPEIKKVIGFLDTARNSSGRVQPFDLMQYMIEIVPNAVPDEIKRIFPISEDEYERLLLTMTQRDARCPQKFVKLANIKSLKDGQPLSGPAFGRVHYQLNAALVNMVNKNNVFPEFKSVVLMILGYNFVQVFSRERQGKLFADVLWPGTVNGNVQIYSKSTSKSPGSDKLSFSVTDM